MNCPLLQSPADYAAEGRWPVVTQRDIAAVLDYDLGAIYQFYSGEQLLARHHSGTVMLFKGYACDGYSPVIRIPWWGGWKFLRLTPTPKGGMFPAIWHDFIRQFCDVDGCPWNRVQTDWWFYDALVAGGTHPDVAGTFYGAVAGPAGDAFIRMTRKTDPKLRIERVRYDP
jgi:hypothetical protein